jgi:hypothetical protein
MIKLNEFGLAVWRHQNDKTLFAEREYEWCDIIIVLKEADNRREIILVEKFSTFDFSKWVSLSQEEFDKVKYNYKEIYDV